MQKNLRPEKHIMFLLFTLRFVMKGCIMKACSALKQFCSLEIPTHIYKVPEQYPRDSHDVSLHADPVYPM